jgi:hypothetical protein
MTSMPVEKKHLPNLLATEGRIVCLVETDDGFHLQISTPGSLDPYTLQAQRNHPRLFKSLNRAAALLQELGSMEFMVKMKQPPQKANWDSDDDSDIPF